MKRLALLLCCLLASGCATKDSACPRLPEGGRYCLQGAALAPFSVQQQVDVTMKDRRETMLVALENDQRSLRFVGLSPFGQKLMHVECAGTQVKASVWPHSNLDPALWCAMLQLTLWPADLARAGLRPPLRLEENGAERRVLAGTQTLIQATRTGATPPFERLQISMPPLDLKLDIRTVNDAGAGL